MDIRLTDRETDEQTDILFIQLHTLHQWQLAKLIKSRATFVLHILSGNIRM